MNTVLRWKFDRVYVATDHPGFSISIHIQAAPLRNGTAKISAFRFRNRRFIEAPINTTVGTSSNPVQDVSAAVGRGTRPGYPVGKAKREQEEEAGAHGAMKALCVCEDSHRSDLPRTRKADTLSCVFDPAQVYAGVSGQADTCTCATAAAEPVVRVTCVHGVATYTATSRAIVCAHIQPAQAVGTQLVRSEGGRWSWVREESRTRV